MSANTESNDLSQDSSAPDQNNADSVNANDAKDGNAEIIDALQKRVDGQSAVLSRMEKMVKEIAARKPEAAQPQEPRKADGEKDPMSELEAAKAEFLNLKAEVEAKEAANREKSRRHLIVADLEARGLPAVAANEAYISITAHEGDKIRMAEDESSVYYQKSEFDEPQSMGDFLDGFLKSERGAIYTPKKANPSSSGRASGVDTGGKQYITKADLSTMSPAELKSGNYILKE